MPSSHLLLAHSSLYLPSRLHPGLGVSFKCASPRNCRLHWDISGFLQLSMDLLRDQGIHWEVTWFNERSGDSPRNHWIHWEINGFTDRLVDSLREQWIYKWIIVFAEVSVGSIIEKFQLRLKGTCPEIVQLGGFFFSKKVPHLIPWFMLWRTFK
jgi:hypothetical protein